MNKMIPLAALGASALIAGLAFSGFSRSGAQDAGGGSDVFSDAQTEEIERLVADYIKDNPKTIIDALVAFEEDERRMAEARQDAALGAATDYLVSNQGAYTAGTDVDNAEIAVVEFFDYHCGYCKRAKGLVMELTNGDPAVKVVFRELPILRKESETAARYALAAREQGKYLDLHFGLLDASGTLSESRILKIAEDKGLDIDALKKAADAAALDDQLADNNEVAQDIGVNGTPGFVIARIDGGYTEVVGGFNPDGVRKAIAAAKKAK
ncbi:MAG: DsbA family protein [Pseudomonadota bacterium]